MLIWIDCFREIQLVFVNISSVLRVGHLWEAWTAGSYFLLAQSLHDWGGSKQVKFSWVLLRCCFGGWFHINTSLYTVNSLLWAIISPMIFYYLTYIRIFNWTKIWLEHYFFVAKILRVPVKLKASFWVGKILWVDHLLTFLTYVTNGRYDCLLWDSERLTTLSASQIASSVDIYLPTAS